MTVSSIFTNTSNGFNINIVYGNFYNLNVKFYLIIPLNRLFINLKFYFIIPSLYSLKQQIDSDRSGMKAEHIIKYNPFIDFYMVLLKIPSI